MGVRTGLVELSGMVGMAAFGNADMAVSGNDVDAAPTARDGVAPLVVRDPAMPVAQGAYDPRNERDGCGVGFVADMHDRRTHAIVE